MTARMEMPPTFVDALANLVIDTEGDGVNYSRDITLRDALGDQAVADVAAEAWASVDWRVLGGLVPGVINAAWLRDGDKVRLNKLDGVVHLHTASRRDGMARFLFVTDTGQVRVERALDAEILVLTPAGVNRG